MARTRYSFTQNLLLHRATWSKGVKKTTLVFLISGLTLIQKVYRRQTGSEVLQARKKINRKRKSSISQKETIAICKVANGSHLFTLREGEWRSLAV